MAEHKDKPFYIMKDEHSPFKSDWPNDTKTGSGDIMSESWKVRIGMDTLVIRPDGSSINFGDAIYHPDNVKEAIVYAKMKNEQENK